MEFKLTEPKKQFSSEALLEDLKQVSIDLGTNNISISEYKKHGNFSYQTLKKRFGSWAKALENAGLEKSKRSWGGDLSETRIPEELLISDMKYVSKKLKKDSITIDDYEKFGKFGSSAICRRFGGWNNAKTKARLKVGRTYNSTEEDYFENIASVWEQLGRQPKYQEMTAPLSKLNISSYERKYGSWRTALEKFIEYVGKKDKTLKIEKETNTKSLRNQKKLKKIISSKVKEKARTNRTANLKQRFKVMKRDGFKCVMCGASPAKDPSVVLHIDHIIPWSKGGETVEKNLQTLCQNCNLGKSNIS